MCVAKRNMVTELGCWYKKQRIWKRAAGNWVKSRMRLASCGLATPAIYKTGSNQSVENYRPISLLSPFSKVIEKLIKSRLISFLNKNQILYERQSGFREKHTTMFPLIDVVTQSFDNINDKLYSCAIALDIKKAFDSVHHSILLNKLSHYGIRGVCHQLFESYLLTKAICMHQWCKLSNAGNKIRSTSGISIGTDTPPVIHKWSQQCIIMQATFVCRWYTIVVFLW